MTRKAFLLLPLLALLAALPLVASAESLPPDASGHEAPRTLFIALDAVPYSVVARVTDPARGNAALFRGYQGPVPLVSTFPSTTSLAFSGILEPFSLERSLGYEAKYYDHEANEIRGGGPISYSQLQFPWRRFWDWKIHGLRGKATIGLHPKKISFRSIRESLAAFLASDRRVFLAYYDATDILGHLHGPDSLEAVLRRLDRSLRELRAEHPERPFRTVLFSDHGLSGGPPLRSVRRAVKRSLKRAGFRISQRLGTERDVVIVPFGLVSSVAIFTYSGQGEEVAASLVGVRGIDFCATPHGDGWRIESAAGAALVHRRQLAGRIEWSYEPQDGDPLGFAPLVAPPKPGVTLARHPASPPESRWHSDAWWLEATADTAYPDALHRLARGFELVENPASVLCSLREGAMYGAATTNLASWLSVGRLRWTHGSMLREASLGFLLSDVPGWDPPPIARFDKALAPFVEGSGYTPSSRSPEAVGR